MKKIFAFFCLLLSFPLWAQVDPSKLLPPLQAFAPKLMMEEHGATLDIAIADGYYLYRQKIIVKSNPEQVFSEIITPQGTMKEDQFFGKQEIYRHAVSVQLPLKDTQNVGLLRVEVQLQGCADVGICYPPTTAVFTINSTGVFMPDNAPSKKKTSLFLSQGEDRQPENASRAKHSGGWSLSAFFLAGLGLSFTACMYPLIPIVSSVVLGQGNVSRRRAFLLSLIYTQGLALTYAIVGVFAGLSGSLLTMRLQQPAVILTAAALMVLLALSMFGVFSIQMPQKISQFFAEKSAHQQGGKILSVFLMGAFSALIIGPCVAPPLAVALGYIGSTGDAVKGGLALYVMACGLGIPLILVSVFGAHILPKAGAWMRAVPIFFGCLMLMAATYMAAPYLPHLLVIAIYVLIILIPAGLLLNQSRKLSGRLKTVSILVASVLMMTSFTLAYVLTQPKSVVAEHLNIWTPTYHTENRIVDVDVLKNKIQQAFAENPHKPVVIDFYADWCVSCQELNARTLSQEKVWQTIDKNRFLTIDVTENTEAHQNLLKEYGLFGPPGLFVLTSPTEHSEALIGFVDAEELIQWYQKHFSGSLKKQ